MPVSATAATEICKDLLPTDPDLAATFGDFVTADVAPQSGLAENTSHLILLAAAIATRSASGIHAQLAAAIRDGVPPGQLKEVSYQAVPYVGIGIAADALGAVNRALLDAGVQLPLPSQSTVTRDTRMTEGLAMQRRIVGGDTVDSMYNNAAADELHLQEYLSANCFGDYYTRGGLDVQTRELVTLALLVALGGCDPQVRGHVGANLNVGNDRGVLIDVTQAK